MTRTHALTNHFKTILSSKAVKKLGNRFTVVWIEWSRWWGNSQGWSWVVHSERVCIHCHPGFSWRLNQVGHSSQKILQKQTLVGPCLLRLVQLPLYLTPLTCFLQFKCTYSAASISKSSCVFLWGGSLEKDYLHSMVGCVCVWLIDQKQVSLVKKPH